MKKTIFVTFVALGMALATGTFAEERQFSVCGKVLKVTNFEKASKKQPLQIIDLLERCQCQRGTERHEDGQLAAPNGGGNTPGQPGNPGASPGASKGNASANNGRGGNYDRTGHSDNGRGNSKNR